jgi:transposase
MIHFHKYKLITDTLKYRYYECSKCGKRKVKIMFSEGYQPIDTKWLNKIPIKLTFQGEKELKYLE